MRKTVYGDGSEIVNWQLSVGRGRCHVLGLETAPDFGCNKFEVGNAQVEIAIKPGAPWQYSRADTCPDCKGNPADHGGLRCRCAGTGLVRHYDDGYIGEEHTRLHPKEKESIEPLKCGNCSSHIEPNWKACPYCGNRLEGVSEIVMVGEGNSGMVGRM